MAARGGGGGAGRLMPKVPHFYSHLSLGRPFVRGSIAAAYQSISFQGFRFSVAKKIRFWGGFDVYTTYVRKEFSTLRF